MNVQSKVIYLAIIMFGLFIVNVPHIYAAPLTFTNARLSTPVPGAYSNYTIAFRSVSGMSSGLIVLDLSLATSNFGNVGYQDIDLMYGATQASLATTAASGTWGVYVNPAARQITFSYPSSNGTAIAAGTIVIVKIGNHASHQSIGNARLVNMSSAVSTKAISITAGSDNGSASVTFVAQVTSNTQMLNSAAGDSKVVTIIAGNDNGALAVPIIPNDTIGVSAVKQDRGTTVGGIFAPTNLITISNKENQATLTWTDNSAIERGYLIERKRTSGRDPEENYREIALTAENEQEYQDNSVESETTYMYRIRAFNEVYLSNYSSVTTVTTLKKAYVSFPFSPPPPTIYVPPAPISRSPEQPREIPIPSNVSSLGGAVSDGTVELQWINPSDSELAFMQIQWSDSVFPQSSDEGVTVMKKMAQSFTDKGLENGKPSYYTVFAVNSFGKYSSGAFGVFTPVEPARPLALPPVVAPPISEAKPAPIKKLSPTPIPTIEKVETIQELKQITITLDSSVTKEFDSDARARLTAKNTDSNKQASSLTVELAPKTIESRYQLVISPRSFEQVKLLDDQATLPAERVALGGIFYQLHARTKDSIVKEFIKPAVLKFSYGTALAKAVDEKTLQAHYWDSRAKSWIPVESEVDVIKKEVRATVKHFTIFTLFGSPSPAMVATKKNPFKVIAKTTLVLPKPVIFQLQDIVERLPGIAMSGTKLVVQRGDVLRFCVSDTLLKKNVVSMTAEIGESHYLLVWDASAKCYGANFSAPFALGVYPLEIKVAYSDDVVQTKAFILEVVERQVLADPEPRPKANKTLSGIFLFLLGDAALLGLIALILVFIVCKRFFSEK